MNLGRLTEAELERQIADGSLKAELKAEMVAKGEALERSRVGG